MTKIAVKITEIFILKLPFNAKDYTKNYLKELYKTFCQNAIIKNKNEELNQNWTNIFLAFVLMFLTTTMLIQE